MLGAAVGITQAALGLPAWTPRRLSALAPGVWFDPSDFSTMFQDSAGTTPVTAFEQPVGLWLDKSQGVALGAELAAVNFNAIPGWTFAQVGSTSGVASVGSGALSLPRVDTSNFAEGGFSVVTVIGKTYQVRWTTGAGGTVQIRAGGSVGNASAGAANLSASSSGTFVFVATANPQVISFAPQTDASTATVSAASVKNLAGNHAFQATTTQRPVASARYNLLTKSEQLDDATWVRTALASVTPNAFGNLEKLVEDATTNEHKVVQNVVLTSGYAYIIRLRIKAAERTSFSFYGSGGLSVGAGSVFINLAAGTVSGGTNATITAQADGSYIVTTQATSTFTGANALHLRAGSGSYAGDGVSGIYVGEVDVRLASDAALSTPAYQRVNTATDYDTANFYAYLKPDGVDDGLATGNIDFTGTSKMTVFAGVTKLSDAAAGAIVELSTIANTTPGSFVLLAPGGALPTTGQYVHGATGLNTISSTPNDKAAPTSYVHTGLFDLSQASPAAQNVERLNGVAYASPNASAGGGNFSLNPLYIGRRFNTSTALNGRIYGLVVVGAALSAAVIASAERWMGQKMGIAL